MDVEKIRQLASIPLKSVDVCTHLPKALGCGCFVQYKGNSLFLTVQHLYTRKDIENGQIYWVDNKEEHLCIEIDYSLENGTSVKPIGEIGFLNNYTSKEWAELEQKPVAQGIVDVHHIIDIAYKKMEYIQCKRKLLDANFNFICDEDRIALPYSLDNLASYDQEYGFSGIVMPNLIPPETMPFRTDKWGLPATNVYHKGLKYIGENGYYLKFSLPFEEHPGHQYFQGTSGAPIIDSDGKLISLVTSGDDKENILYGINLQKIMPCIEKELNI